MVGELLVASVGDGDGIMGNLKSGIAPGLFLGGCPPTKPGVLGAVDAPDPRPKLCFDGGKEWLKTGEFSDAKGRLGKAAECGPPLINAPLGDICKLADLPWPRLGR